MSGFDQTSGYQNAIKQEPVKQEFIKPEGVKQEFGSERKKRNRWGAPIVQEVKPAEAANGQPRKRKSRWESAETNTSRALAVIPREVTLPGGIKVCQFFSVVCSQNAGIMLPEHLKNRLVSDTKPLIFRHHYPVLSVLHYPSGEHVC